MSGSNFTAADAEALFSAIRSMAKQLHIFDATIGHDPEGPPTTGLACSIALGPVKPTSSGLASISLEVTLMVHVWSLAARRPLDKVDPQVLAAACSLMAAFAGGFTLGETVRDIRLPGLSAAPGYVNFADKEFRTMSITVPIEINDVLPEVA